MSVFTKIKEGYDSLWKSYVRPPRDDYKIEDLGPKRFYYNGRKYQRKDFSIFNKQGLKIVVSLFHPVLRVKEYIPCIIYLHGNSSSRIEGLTCLDVAVPNNMMLCVFDSIGTGMSEGEYVSLGYHEHEDLALLIDHLIQNEKASQIALWGRSMGSVTSIYYASKYELNQGTKVIPYQKISAMILDSPFSSLKSLSEDLASIHTKVPGFIVSAALGIVRNKILTKAPLDIFAVNPIEQAPAVKTIPALFITADKDITVPPSQTKRIFEQYGCHDKTFITVEGDHNSPRPDDLYQKIQKFVYEKLNCKELVEPYEWGYLRGSEYDHFGWVGYLEDESNIFLSSSEWEKKLLESHAKDQKTKNNECDITVQEESKCVSNIKMMIQSQKAHIRVGDTEGLRQNFIELGKELENVKLDDQLMRLEADNILKEEEADVVSTKVQVNSPA